MSSRILLFDVDGTLVHAGGAGRRAFNRALEAVFGPAVRPREGHLNELRLDGMTDRLIVREVMRELGFPFDGATCDRVLAVYVENLPAELEGPGFKVLPGVERLLQALVSQGVVLGLCTGNVREGARQKLARGGLDHHFRFEDGGVNGFAEDGEDRADIVRAAMRRASDRLGREVSPREVLVIGDTPRDIQAAHAAGCLALGVATGRYSVDEFVDARAEAGTPSLAEPWVLELLLE